MFEDYTDKICGKKILFFLRERRNSSKVWLLTYKYRMYIIDSMQVQLLEDCLLKHLQYG